MVDKKQDSPSGMERIGLARASRRAPSDAVQNVLLGITGISTLNDPLAVKRQQAMERFMSWAASLDTQGLSEEMTPVSARLPVNLYSALCDWCAAHEYGPKRSDKMYPTYILSDLLLGFIMAMYRNGMYEKFEEKWENGKGMPLPEMVYEALAQYLEKPANEE